MQITESLGNRLRVSAGVLDVITDRLAVAADIDNDVVPNDAVVHGFARSQLYVKAVGRGVVMEFRARSVKSESW
jgi:hypothetical protein